MADVTQNKLEESSRNEHLVEPFNEWSKAKWRQTKLLIDMN